MMNSGEVPMYRRGNDGCPAQPGGPAVFQTTAVNIVTEHPKDHIIWSLFSFVYMNPCCLGLVPLIYSIKSRDQKMIGDLEGARRHGSKARIFNWVATIVTIICVFSLIILPLVNRRLYHTNSGYGN